jgi:predicted RNase H-like HicB family nuclease
MILTAIYQQSGDWWAAWIEELPGANTQGRTLEEARENVREAAQLILEEGETPKAAHDPLVAGAIREPFTVAGT